MVTFLIARHGYSEGNKEKRFSGQLDVPLDSVGWAQAESLKDFVLSHYKIDAIYASDLCRAFDTAKPLADALGMKVQAHRDFREVDVGAWQGKRIEDVKNEYPAEFEAYKNSPGTFRFPEGEGYADVRERAFEALKKLGEENDGKTIFIGTHGGVVRNLRAVWEGISLSQIGSIPHVPNASLCVVRYEDGKISPVLVGFCDYLSDKTTEEGIK